MRKRRIALILSFVMFFNMIPVISFASGSSPSLGTVSWSEISSFPSNGEKWEVVRYSSNFLAVELGKDLSQTRAYMSYDALNWNAWNFSGSGKLNKISSIKNGYLIETVEDGQFKLGTYNTSRRQTTVSEPSSEPILKMIETVEYSQVYSPFGQSSTPGKFVVAKASGLVQEYEYEYNYNGFQTTLVKEVRLEDGVEDIEFYNNRYYIVDTLGNVHVYNQIDSDATEVQAGFHTDRTVFFNGDQYILNLNGGDLIIAKRNGSAVVEKVQSGADVELEIFKVSGDRIVVMGKNKSTGNAYVLTSNDGDSWYTESSVKSDASLSTGSMSTVEVNNEKTIHVGATSDGKLFARVMPTEVESLETGVIEARSAVLNGQLASGERILSKGIQVTEAADSTFASALVIATSSFVYDPANPNAKVFNATATGLSPHTEYRYRAYADDSGGRVYGASKTFTTHYETAVTILPEEKITESNIDGMNVILKLDDGTFLDNTIGLSNISLSSFPVGTSLQSIHYIDDRTLRLTLGFDSNFNINDLFPEAHVEVSGTEISTGQTIRSNNVLVRAEYETPRALVNGLGGENGFGENKLQKGDDFSVEIDLTPAFPDGLKFGSKVYTNAHLNINGALHFGQANSTYTPTGIEEANEPIIAVFWTDLKNSAQNNGITNELDEDGVAVGHSTGSNEVYYDFDEENKVFTVTWDDVAAFNVPNTHIGTDPLNGTNGSNAFQLRLHNTGDGNVRIEFVYETIQVPNGNNGTARIGWSTGEKPKSSGGITGQDFYEFPSSGDDQKLLDLAHSRGSAGQIGTYQSIIEEGQVVNDLSSNNNLSSLTMSAGALTPNFDLAITGYSATVASDVSLITVNAALEDATTATLKIAGQPWASGVESNAVNLVTGLNQVEVLVTAEDGAEKTYLLQIIRQAVPMFTATYDSQGGSGVSGQTVESGQNITQPLDPARAGYEFDGWYKTADLNTQWNFDVDTLNANQILYAQWNPVNYHVKYYGNGAEDGSVPTDSTNYHLGDTLTLSDNTGELVRNGYRFTGWKTQPLGNTSVFLEGTELRVNQDINLYANWEQIPKHSLSYQGNGETSGSVPVAAKDYFEGVHVTISDNTGNLDKTGHKFAGWTYQTSGGAITVQPGDRVKIDEQDIVFAANWTLLPTYKVVYNGNGYEAGNLPVDGSKYLEGQHAITKSKGLLLQRNGYTFTGWNTEANGQGKHIELGQSIEINDQDVTLYAEWLQLPTYRVTYNGNGYGSGFVPVDHNNYPEGSYVAIQGNPKALMRGGYIFNGWNTKADGTGQRLDYKDTLEMGNQDISLYAQWTTETTYGLTYDTNGATIGQAPEDNNVYPNGQKVIVLANSGRLRRPGYSFAGWNTSVNGSGKTYYPGSYLALEQNQTLYAQWSPSRMVGVTYNGNGNDGGSVPVDTRTFKPGDGFYPLDNTSSLTKAGFNFAGWSLEQDGSGLVYSSATPVKAGLDNVTFYAVWSTDPVYSVTYHASGSEAGEIPKGTLSYKEGAPVKITQNTGHLTRYGYELVGWNTQPDGSGVLYEMGDTIRMGTENLSLYAHWTTQPVYKVTYSGNGQESGSVPETQTYIMPQEALVQGASDLTKSGYKFEGWNTQANGKGKDYQPFEKISNLNDDITLYAKWSVKPTYTVTYNGNGSESGQVPSDSNNYIENTLALIMDNSRNLSKSGFIFEGWNTQADGEGEHYAVGNSFEVKGDLTLYAQWSVPVHYGLSYYGFDNDGGFLPVDNNNYLLGSQAVVFGNIGNLTKDGYNWTGWNTKADGSGTAYELASPISIKENDVNLYAQWSEKSYDVKFEYTSTSSGAIRVWPDNFSAKYNSVLPVVTTPEREGHAFVGWYSDEERTQAIQLGVAKMPNHDLTLYPKWLKGDYVVSYNLGGGTSTSPGAITLEYNDLIPEPDQPQRTGYAFDGWFHDTDYRNAVDFNHDRIGEKSITLYAKWSAKVYNLNLELGGGMVTSPGAIQVTFGDVLPAVETPTKTGFKFINWFYDSNMSNVVQLGVDKMPSNNLSIHAKWEPKAFAINYVLNGGQHVNTPVINKTFGSTLTSINTPSRYGMQFGGWYYDVNLNRKVTVNDTMPASDVTLYAKWIYISSSGESGGSSKSEEKPVEKPKAIVVVNGKRHTTGDEKLQVSGGVRRVDVKINHDEVQSLINNAVTGNELSGARNIVEIPVTHSDVSASNVRLTGDIVKQMEESTFDLAIRMDDIAYIIPAKEITIDKVAQQLDVNPDELIKIEVNVVIKKADVNRVQEIRNKIEAEIVVEPVVFEVMAKTYDSNKKTKSVIIDRFQEYVKRELSVPAEVDPSRITTAVVYNDDGTYTHIPTRVEKRGQGYVAVINSLTNSVYTLVFNEKDYNDVDQHWGQDAIVDLGSRFILDGLGHDSFRPDDYITRSEFATIMTQGLGVMRPHDETLPFVDVMKSYQHSDRIYSAIEFNLFSGYPDGTFRPNNQISREEAFVVISHVLELTGVELKDFDSVALSLYSDGDDVSGWAVDGVSNLLYHGIIEGYNNTLTPKQPLTRAEAVSMMRKILIESNLINE